MKLSLLPVFLYFFALSWASFSVFWFFRDSDYRYFYSVMGSMYALALSFSAYFIHKRRMWAWWVATILVGMSVVAGICDQIGLIDLAFIVWGITLFIILLKKHSDMKHGSL